jgi:hypothetical protein
MFVVRSFSDLCDLPELDFVLEVSRFPAVELLFLLRSGGPIFLFTGIDAFKRERFLPVELDAYINTNKKQLGNLSVLSLRWSNWLVS